MKKLEAAWDFLVEFTPQILVLIALVEALFAFPGDGVNVHHIFWALFNVLVAIFCVVVRIQYRDRNPK